MNNIFKKTGSYWVRYSKYEYKENKDILYAVPAPEAKVSLYDPLKDGGGIVVDALNVGITAINSTDKNEVKAAVFDFVSKYGLLGIMTALPTTPKFMDYNAVYFPKNHFIKAESMNASDYVSMFFPFKEPDFFKDGKSSEWNIANDREMTALAMTMNNEPMAYIMSLTRNYAERYDWIVRQLKDLAFTFCTSVLYYEESEKLDEITKGLYRQGISAFGGIAPTYRIALYDKPEIVWDFHSLLLGIQMMFSFMLTDEANPLCLCKRCNKAFLSSDSKNGFCSLRCESQRNP